MTERTAAANTSTNSLRQSRNSPPEQAQGQEADSITTNPIPETVQRRLSKALSDRISHGWSQYED